MSSSRGWSPVRASDTDDELPSPRRRSKRSYTQMAFFAVATVAVLATIFGLVFGLPHRSRKGSLMDVDECLFDNPVCPETAECINILGSFVCVCPSGYELIHHEGNLTCVDIDECSHEENACTLANGTCTNEEGWFDCNCTTGQEWNNITCIDIDECAIADSQNISICPLHETCYNTDSSYYCNCTGAAFVFAGQEEDTNLFACQCLDYADVPCMYRDPCEDPDNDCAGSEAVCVDLSSGSTGCVCPVNQTWYNDACVDACTSISCQNATCTIPTDVVCVCSDHLIYNGSDCNETCSYFNPSPSCVCDDGFLYVQGEGCIPDPCADPDNICSTLPNATSCVSSVFGSTITVTCLCENGFVFDEDQCVDYCTVETTCADTGGVCNSTDQSCLCPNARDGSSCLDTCELVPQCNVTDGTCVLNEPNTSNVTCSCPVNQTYSETYGCVSLCDVISNCTATNGTCTFDSETGDPLCDCPSGLVEVDGECAPRCVLYPQCESSGGTCNPNHGIDDMPCLCPEGQIFRCPV